MKKVVLAMTAVVLLSLSFLAGCGGSAPETLDGTSWKITEAAVEGEKVDMALLRREAGMDEIFLKFEDGYASFTGLIDEEPTPYGYENGKLTMDPYTTKVRGDTLYVEQGFLALTLEKE